MLKLSRILLAAYLVLLASSHLVRRLPREPQLGDRQAVELQAVDGDGRRLDRPIAVTYLEWGEERRGQLPTVVLIHGSPGAASNFDSLAPLLAEKHHLLAPDLPGFGPARSDAPSLAIKAHADYVDQLLAELRVERAHLIGFSLGGAVAIDLADPLDSPDSMVIESLTLLAATGVQELELFGGYAVNHAVHGLQLVALTLVDNLFPHFGTLDDAMLGVNYARNFFDSDQRPMREILTRIEVPALVLHGRKDSLVPVAAAQEHHRLLPQSELAVTEFGHLMIFLHPERVASTLEGFFAGVETGQALDRASAAAERVRRAAQPYVPSPSPAEGLALLTLIGLLAAGTWVSEDLATIAAGLLVGDQRLAFGWASLAAIVGILSGDLVIYACGRWLRERALSSPPLKWLLPPERVKRARRLFETQGPWVIFASRFTPGTRVATYFAAGLVRTGAVRFALYLALAALLWVPAVVGLSAWVGDPIFALVDRFQSGGWLLALVALLAVWWLVHTLPLLFSKPGRALVGARWARRARWEFLPSWVIYLPLLPYLAWLAVRHRGLTFTAANPDLLDGGVVGESKSAGLARLPTGAVPEYVVLEPQLDLEAARLQAHDCFRRFGPPVVLKPDVGERGRAVVVARTPQEVSDYFGRTPETTICQRYVGGEEFGVFWIDDPDAEVGRVWSVAAKHLPEVTGDGESSLRQLILDHPRVRFHADRFLRRRNDLDRTPGSGESVRLGDLGTHCRGATFTDAGRLVTEALTAEITRLSRSAGFCFGRYDVRVPNADQLAQGRELSILEFNGVSSEAVHIYDPRASFANALKTLARQWRLAFELGARLAEEGAEVMPLRSFVAHVWSVVRHR